MSKSVEQFLFEAQRLTPEARRDRLEQLNPNGPNLAAAFDEELKAALHNNVFLIGVSADVRAQRTAILGKQIADELVKEFEALQLANRGAERRERIAAMNAGWFPMQGTTPEVQTENLRAALELIRPKFAAKADVPETATAKLPAEFGLAKGKAFFNGQEIFEAVSDYAELVGKKRGVSRSRVMEILAAEDGRKPGERTNQTYSFSREEVIVILSKIFDR
jgi:hypothetical protein